MTGRPDVFAPIAPTAVTARQDFREVYAEHLRERAAGYEAQAAEADAAGDPAAAGVFRAYARTDRGVARITRPT